MPDDEYDAGMASPFPIPCLSPHSGPATGACNNLQPKHFSNCHWLLIGVMGLSQALGAGEYPVQPVPFTEVTLTDSFWAPRQAINRAVTVEHNFREMEKQGSLGGFAVLAGDKTGKYHGYLWGDSDVYKTIEGAGYLLKTQANPALEQRIAGIIAQIQRAQAPDGFIFPHLQITEPNYVKFSRETTGTCESYSMGHLIEAAVEYSRMTGRTDFLGVARRAADLMVKVNKEGKLLQVSGHPQVEIALVKLFRATGQQEYLDLAQRLVDGYKTHLSLWSGGKPALAHDDVLGHAVAVMYLYSGAADVGVLTGDSSLIDLLAGKWDRMVSRKMYLTGGVGHSRHHEGFADDYDLPAEKDVYSETCSAIADVFWSGRMFQATGESKYYDVLERVLYNNLAAGAGLSGDRFFYTNPLASAGKDSRWAWHGCPCCPVNLVRFWPRLSEYFFATGPADLYINLFAACEGKATVAGTEVRICQKTDYPWDGKVTLEIFAEKPVEFALRVRIPGWAEGRPLPSDLYQYVPPVTEQVDLKVNGRETDRVRDKGYAVIRRQWQTGDRVELNFPMPVRTVVANAKVAALKGRVAVERGPLVYCAEGVDNAGKLAGLVLPPSAGWRVEKQAGLLNGLCTIKGALTLVPYYAWSHRGAGEMKVWFEDSVRIEP